MKCKFCAASHGRGNCPAYGAMCHNCNERNHYARCCFKSKNGTEERRVRHVEVEDNENNELLEGLCIEEIQGSTRRNIQSDLLVNDIPVSLKLDTGAECNVISLALANDLNAQVQPTSMLLKSFGGHQLILWANAFLRRRQRRLKVQLPWSFMYSEIM